MRQILLSCAVATLVLACDAGKDSTTGPGGSASVVVDTTKGAPPLTTAGAASAPQSTSDTGARHPPTGMYEITTKIVTDTCNTGATAPPPVTLLVQGKAEKSIAMVNIPLVALVSKAPGTSHGLNRSDVNVEPRKPFQTKFAPVPNCEFKVARSLEVKDATHDRIVVVSTEDRGDPAACAPNEASKCSTSIEYTFNLVKLYCEAECTADVRARADGGADPKCTCP